MPYRLVIVSACAPEVVESRHFPEAQKEEDVISSNLFESGLASANGYISSVETKPDRGHVKLRKIGLSELHPTML